MAATLAGTGAGIGAGISMADLFSTALAEQERQRAKLASGHATLLAEVSAMEHASQEKRARLMARIVTGKTASGGVVEDGGDSPPPPFNEHKENELMGATTNQDGDGDEEDEQEWTRNQGITTCVLHHMQPRQKTVPFALA